MKVLDDAHRYELSNFDKPEEPGQQLFFVNKKPAESGDGLVLVHDGTTNEEVLAMLINRTQTLNSKFPCRENALAITKMEEALMWFNKRTAGRKERGVEGKHLK